jgi:hypothetical protein
VSKRLQELARRKSLLITRCGHEREEIASLCNEIRSRLNLLSVAQSLGKGLSAHPIIAAGISGLCVSGYAGKIVRSVGPLLNLWRLARPLWFWWSKRGDRA